jgi:signal transduction histidine kinase
MGTAGGGSFNLGPRLTFIFATLIALILGGNSLVVSQFRITHDETERLTGANQQLIAVLRLQDNLLSYHRRLDDLARSMDVRRLVVEAESLRGSLKAQSRETRAAIANLPSETAVDPAFLPTLDTIDVTLPAEIEAIVELAESGDWAGIPPRVDAELNPMETQTAILVNSINQQASGELARGVTKMARIQRRMLIIVPATALSTFLTAAFFGWSIARRFIELRFEERVGERLRISRELHDTLLQTFLAALLKLDAEVSIAECSAESRVRLERAIQQARGAITEGRQAIEALRSSTIVSNDLVRAFTAAGEELASRFPHDRCPEFHILVEGATRDLIPIVRDEAYRIAGEALRNAFHHAEARTIELTIRYEKKRIVLLVADDGRGIELKVMSEGSRAGHHGLPGMRERARLAGGRLEVRSRIGAGTEIELTVPAAIAYEKHQHVRRIRLFHRPSDGDRRS